MPRVAVSQPRVAAMAILSLATDSLTKARSYKSIQARVLRVTLGSDASAIRFVASEAMGSRYEPRPSPGSQVRLAG